MWTNQTSLTSHVATWPQSNANLSRAKSQLCNDHNYWLVIWWNSLNQQQWAYAKAINFGSVARLVHNKQQSILSIFTTNRSRIETEVKFLTILQVFFQGVFGSFNKYIQDRSMTDPWQIRRRESFGAVVGGDSCRNVHNMFRWCSWGNLLVEEQHSDDEVYITFEMTICTAFLI